MLASPFQGNRLDHQPLIRRPSRQAKSLSTCNGLFPWDPSTDVVLILPPTKLANLERGQAGRPSPLVRILHQILDDVRRASGFGERAFDHCLQGRLEKVMGHEEELDNGNKQRQYL